MCGCAQDDSRGPEIQGNTERERYSRTHESRRLLPEKPSQASASASDARPPGFPSLEDLKELNREIHDEAGTPERLRLDQPSPLESNLARAQAAWADTPDGVIRTAALLAFGIADAQAFVDGNRRTAYFATLAFLEANGFQHLSPQGDDHMLARFLNQVVENEYGQRPRPEKLVDLFRRRLERARWGDC